MSAISGPGVCRLGVLLCQWDRFKALFDLGCAHKIHDGHRARSLLSRAGLRAGALESGERRTAASPARGPLKQQIVDSWWLQGDVNDRFVDTWGGRIRYSSATATDQNSDRNPMGPLTFGQFAVAAVPTPMPIATH